MNLSVSSGCKPLLTVFRSGWHDASDSGTAPNKVAAETHLLGSLVWEPWRFVDQTGPAVNCIRSTLIQHLGQKDSREICWPRLLGRDCMHSFDNMVYSVDFI